MARVIEETKLGYIMGYEPSAYRCLFLNPCLDQQGEVFHRYVLRIGTTYMIV